MELMVGSPLKEGVFAWVKGIGSRFRTLCLGTWSLEEKAGKELIRVEDSGVKDLPGAGDGEVAGQEKGDFGLQRSLWRVLRDLPEAGEYAPLWSGLFRPLWSLAYGGFLVGSRVSSSTCR